jgi:hypothetical protein
MRGYCWFDVSKPALICYFAILAIGILDNFDPKVVINVVFCIYGEIFSFNTPSQDS